MKAVACLALLVCIAGPATAEVMPWFGHLPDPRARALALGTDRLLGMAQARLGHAAEAALRLLTEGPMMAARASAISEQELEAWQQLVNGAKAGHAGESTQVPPARSRHRLGQD
jgi:hypothetical protein